MRTTVDILKPILVDEYFPSSSDDSLSHGVDIDGSLGPTKGCVGDVLWLIGGSGSTDFILRFGKNNKAIRGKNHDFPVD